MIASKVLISLPEEYAYFVSAWDSTDTIDRETLENLTARLIAEEMRIGAKHDEENKVAFKVTGKKYFKCNKLGHFAKDCTQSNGLNTSGRQILFQCNKTGYVEKFCKEKLQLKNEESCSICKKFNHTDKTYYFRKNKNKKNEYVKNLLFLISKIEECLDYRFKYNNEHDK